MDALLPVLYVFAVGVLQGTVGQTYGVQGPVFLQEPPSSLTFSNTSGSQVSCSAHGSPTPQVDWILQDGSLVTAVPGLRQSLGNGTLYFPPFRAQDYRKDIHSTVYLCRASNLVGTIVSRDVRVQAVVSQYYDVQVYRAHALTGNTAVLSCVIPAYVREHVTVTSWFRDDSILLPGRAEMGGRYIVTSGTGDLHIRSARAEDGLARYSCLTLHSLTQERKRSAPAILTVTEATGSMPPRLTPRILTTITAERGVDVHLSCSAQGNPPPTFTWYREIGGVLRMVAPSLRVVPSQDILYIRRVEAEDAGRWSCTVSNQFGEQKLDTHLIVMAHLSVHVVPKLQVVNSGESAMFNCSVTGTPITSVHWLRNGERLNIGGPGDPEGEDGEHVRQIAPLVLSVTGVTRHDRGMYQCVVWNDRETAQASAELRLGDTVPELQYTFIEQALRPGPQVSLRCSATGSPPPQFRWLLDGEPLSELTAGHRYAIGQYVDHAGDVISHLNITNVRVEDGGLYSCKAGNMLGAASHSARLNVYGPPFIRSIGAIQAVAGTDVIMHCPFSGYPIAQVKWERRGQELPLDLRHHVEDPQSGGSLVISRIDPNTDAGSYTCEVVNRNGEMARRDIQLVVHSPPVLEPFSFPSSLQEGGRAQVTCSVTSGDMPIQFTWYKDNTPISSALQIEERAAEFFSMLIFKEVTSKHSGSYTCVASNSAARANYTTQLMVKVAPQWIMEPQDVSTLLGKSVTVNCDAKGFPKPQITWLKGQGQTSQDYQPVQNMHPRPVLLANGSMWIESISTQEEGHYLCRAINGIGAGLGKVIYIDVNEPVRFDTPTRNISSKRSESTVLQCQVFGDAPIEVNWYFNGKRMENNNYRYTVTDLKMERGLKSQLAISSTDRDDSGLYICQAENAYGRSEHLIFLAIQERPDPPVALEVVEVNSRSVRLSWGRPFDGNSPVLGYMVQYQPLGSLRPEWDHTGAQNITLPANAVGTVSVENDIRDTALVGGLSPATAYSMRMLAVNNIDQSAFTEPVVVKTQEEAPADAPQKVLVKSIGQTELFLTWQVPPKESWNGELLGYIVTWNEQGLLANNSRSITVKGWGTTQVQITGLKKFTRYDIMVKAYNSVAPGPSSPTIVGTTQEGVPEAPPVHVTCNQITSQSMKISWSPPAATQHGGVIQGYKIFFQPIGTDNLEISTAGEIKRTPSCETYLHALYKYTNYSIKVLAYTSAGDGAVSPALFCATEEDVPGPPANIKALALTGESIFVSWLPPSKPNGNIKLYTVYAREAGRVGQHTSYTVRTEDTINSVGLMFEVRHLKEHQPYEFWISATTNVGEGEPTPIVEQTTVIKAPSRIASFSQVVYKPVKSQVLLPCVAVGNPTPRTRWLHRDRPITFSMFYEVTTDGHLNIHSTDHSLSGNYTCSAKNLFGEDEITYTLVVLMPPGPPHLEVQYSTAKTIRLKWKHPLDGGTSLQGYSLSVRKGSENWQVVEISPEITTYTFENMYCGTMYHIYLVAHNRVGNGSPSTLISISTKGGAPHLAKDVDFFQSNATTIQLNLHSIPDGGCPITQYAIEYKMQGEEQWQLVSSNIPGDVFFIHDLQVATWYQVRVTAQNDAGSIIGIYNCATTTLTGAKIPLPPKIVNETETSSYAFKDIYIIGPIISVLVLLICGAFLWFIMDKKRRDPEDEIEQEDEQVDEKTVERDNRRNCQQVYSSSPVKTSDKLVDDGSGSSLGMYEISPYATFNVPGGGNRTVNTTTLDYTMQFKTFGHLENEENAESYPKIIEKRTWHKHRYYNTDDHRIRQHRMRGERNAHRADSESEDTSGSPRNEYSVNYRVPVKMNRDIFRPDSSTESNDVSPMTERRHTPRHVGAVPRRQERQERHRPASSSSSTSRCSSTDDLTRCATLAMKSTASPRTLNLRLQPSAQFADSRELSEAECDRDGGIMRRSPTKLPVELASLLARYQEKKEQERKEFTIHV